MAGGYRTLTGCVLLAAWICVALAQEREVINGGRTIIQFSRYQQEKEKAAVIQEDEQLCERSVKNLLPKEWSQALTSTVALAIHRNGEVEACGNVPTSVRLMDAALQSFPAHNCPPDGRDLDKYMTETLLTEFVSQQLPRNSCNATDNVRIKSLKGFHQFCDRGPENTPPQPDLALLKPVPSGSLPCRFYTREGVRVSSLKQLAIMVKNSTKIPADPIGDNGTESCGTTEFNLDLYAVPAGRVFVFAPKFVGEIFDVQHVRGSNGKPLSLEVLSLSPRMFEIHNFFDGEDADKLVQNVLDKTTKTHKLQPSKGFFKYRRRTSEHGWDTDGELAMELKERCMKALGFDVYYESHTDGLQIVRYNQTKAYEPHMDYVEDTSWTAYDYRSQYKGGNRFATVLLYMTDTPAGAGGETVFSRKEISPNFFITKNEMVHMLRTQGAVNALEMGSWEEEMTGICRTRFTITPRKSRAVLFYNQHPNGTEDIMSFHGACPVLHGTKWMANLWVWNAARDGFEHAPFKSGQDTKQMGGFGSYTSVSALFFNSGSDPRFKGAKLYWNDKYFCELDFGEHMRVNTFVSHKWQVKDARGNLLKSWTIEYVTTDVQHYTV